MKKYWFLCLCSFQAFTGDEINFLEEGMYYCEETAFTAIIGGKPDVYKPEKLKIKIKDGSLFIEKGGASHEIVPEKLTIAKTYVHGYDGIYRLHMKNSSSPKSIVFYYYYNSVFPTTSPIQAIAQGTCNIW